MIRIEYLGPISVREISGKSQVETSPILPWPQGVGPWLGQVRD